MIELLSPVGDFECLKAAVQNGADTVYFGSSMFSARAFASNFDELSLENAINYAKIHGVKTNLTLNTLIKNSELNEAIQLAQKAYQLGIDAIIVQDLGLARFLIKNLPGIKIHGSTQMSVHNLEGVLELQNLGFSRVVLSRELSIEEIEYICKNSNIEIEVFVHGALCISYSGQCLFSSMVGGRSGNRGKCAQPCRLPYELQENGTSIDKGFLLSPRDLCGLDYLPQLVKAGVSCLKIEGRMKTPEYVATVTRIYRKYLDLCINKETFEVNEYDKKELLQVFNRGGFSSGHLNSDSNSNLVYPQKPNNMGLFVGTVSNFNSNHGYISFTTNEILRIGDKITVENKNHENSTYTISELMINNKNIKQANPGDKVKIGRMKGNIYVGNKIYKTSDKLLSASVIESIDKDCRKRELVCNISIRKNMPISVCISDADNIKIDILSDIIPEQAINSPITKERIISQFSKTNNTPFVFKEFNIELDDGLYISSISSLNELRRNAICLYEAKLINSFKREVKNLPQYTPNRVNNTISASPKISILLNILDVNLDYNSLQNVNNIYIPLKYFILKDYSICLKSLCENFNVYIYMPTIMRNNYRTLIKNNLTSILDIYNVKGFIVSNMSNFEMLKNYIDKYDFVANYTLNIYNDLTICELNVNTITLSPELNKFDLQNLYSNKNTELIVYGKTPLMNSNYCLLGKTNKCYSSCYKRCMSSNKYFLKDRLGFLFRVIPDNIETVSTIYNSKTTSINYSDININNIRLDFLDESISEINDIINTVKTGKKIEGTDFTNGNFNREV